MPQIEPQPNIVYLDFPKTQAGVLDTSSKVSANECATVIAVGEGVTGIKAGDTVFVKAWSVDSVVHEDTTYRFVNIQTNGILAVVR